MGPQLVCLREASAARGLTKVRCCVSDLSAILGELRSGRVRIVSETNIKFRGTASATPATQILFEMLAYFNLSRNANGEGGCPPFPVKE